jgi:DNA-binding MarR family transcriptional regulator
MVDALEDEGVLVRQPHATDRRAILLELTPQGIAQVETIQQALASISDTVLAPLTAAERAELARLLTALVERDEG